MSLSGLAETPYAGFSSAFFVVIMILMAVLYFFPIYYLFTFSKLSKLAVDNNDGGSFSEAMRYLKMHYRYMGILMIVVLSIYVVILIIAVMAGSMLSIFNT